MGKTIWYISKYFAHQTDKSPGGRSWFLVKEFYKQGYKPVVITSDSNKLVDVPCLRKRVTTFSKDGVDVIWLKTLKYTVAKSVRRVLSWFHFEFNLFFLNKSEIPKPDAIIVSSLSLLTIINGILLKKKYGCKLVFEIRDIWPLTIIEEGGFSPRNPFVIFLSFVERLGYQKSDIIVGTMPNLSEHVENIIGRVKPVKCIPMGFDPSMIEDTNEISLEYISKYLCKDYFNVVHAGTVGITNSLETFFKAAELLKDNKKIRFVIVGDGPLKNAYQKKYSHFSNIIFAPKVNKNQVQSVLSFADVVYFSVFKSKVWEYGQSLNKVVDYMLSGKPVLASYSGYPSMIDEAECGFILPAEDFYSLANKIEELSLMSEEDLDSIGAKGREWILNNRKYEKLAKDYLSLLFNSDD